MDSINGLQIITSNFAVEQGRWLDLKGVAMVTKRDVENMQEELKAAIMREDWEVCDVLVKQIGEDLERLRQPTKRAVDAATPCPYCKRVHDNRLACPEYVAITPHH